TVAAKAAAKLVVDAAFAHPLERGVHDPGLALAQAELEVRRMRKLRRGAETAVARVEIGSQQVEQRPDRRRIQLNALAEARQRAFERLHDLGVLRADLGALLAPYLRDALAQIGKRRHAVARRLRKVGPAEERRAVGREKHRERPAPGALREHLVRALVDL